MTTTTEGIDCPGAEVCYNRCDQHPCPFCDPDRLPEARQSVLGPGNRWFWVFEPLNPVVPGHRLVVPKVHVRDAVADPWVAAAAMDVAARLVRDHYESANIITSIGPEATQSVFHLHLHIVPRVEGDGILLPWTVQQQREKYGQDAIMCGGCGSVGTTGEGGAIPHAEGCRWTRPSQALMYEREEKMALDLLRSED